MVVRNGAGTGDVGVMEVCSLSLNAMEGDGG